MADAAPARTVNALLALPMWFVAIKRKPKHRSALTAKQKESSKSKQAERVPVLGVLRCGARSLCVCMLQTRLGDPAMDGEAYEATLQALAQVT